MNSMESQTVKFLHEHCKQRKYTGYSKLNKADLVKFINSKEEIVVSKKRKRNTVVKCNKKGWRATQTGLSSEEIMGYPDDE